MHVAMSRNLGRQGGQPNQIGPLSHNAFGRFDSVDHLQVTGILVAQPDWPPFEQFTRSLNKDHRPAAIINDS